MVEQVDVKCGRCSESCYGEVICAYGIYYHQYCFSCIVAGCNQDLKRVGYFVIDDIIYCRNDYHKLMGTKCAGCNKFVEGEVVSALESKFHPKCFGCVTCGKIFPVGTVICYDGEDFFCQACNISPSSKDVTDSLPSIDSAKKGKDLSSPINNDHMKNGRHSPNTKSEISNSSSPTGGKDEVSNDNLLVDSTKNEASNHSSLGGNNTLHNVSNDSSPIGSTKQELSPHSSPADDTKQIYKPPSPRDGNNNNINSDSRCAGCNNHIKSGQALLALDKQWHLWCFTCHKCRALLTGEYMGRDGIPYCERDYQAEFGITCAGCGDYITGKVLQAGEKHYHPGCSRCAKCGQLFGEGEDMYLQGSEIWHPECSEEMHLGDEHNSSESDDSEFENRSATVCVGNKSVDNPTETPSAPPPNVWKPSTETTHPAPSMKPRGFRSVKPPQPITSKTSDDENDAPPVPPPPTRSSSSSWRQKYASGVYGAAPYKPPSEERKPASYSGSVSSLDGNVDNHNCEINGKPVSPATMRAYQKGIGYNQLQHRKSLRENEKKSFKLPTDIDPDRLRKFLDDPDHNVYLEDREFHQIFKMTREKFYALPQSKKEELKNAVLILKKTS